MTAERTTICWVREPPRPRAPIAPPSRPATPGQALAGNAAGTYTCNPDFNVSQLGVNLPAGHPVKNLTFTAEVQWFHLDQKMSGIFGVHGDRSEAERALRVQGSGHGPAAAPRPAQLLIVELEKARVHT